MAQRPAADVQRPTRLTRRQALGLAGLGAALLAGGYAAHDFSGAVAAARRRVAGRSEVMATRFGRLEYAIAGEGPPLLMIHGTGGGFDQGLGFARAIMARRYRIVAPSRFGYLRSDYPAEPSSENQADALVELLDRLGIDRLAVAGGSAGALSAVQLALRHPDRCSALVLLVPAANVQGRDPVEMGPFQQFAVRNLLTSDFLFWTALKTEPRQLIGTLLATNPALLDRVGAAERRRAFRILEELMPISARWRGMLNDGRLAGDPAPVDFTKIRVPSLIVSVEDDRFGTAATARHMAGQIAGARLVIYPTGGHIWLGHDEDVGSEVAGFLLSHSNPLAPPGASA